MTHAWRGATAIRTLQRSTPDSHTAAPFGVPGVERAGIPQRRLSMTSIGAGTQGPTATIRCSFCSKLNRIDMERAADRPRCGECGRPMLLDRPVRIEGDDLESLVADSQVPILVDFHADWCGPCKVMAPVLDELAADQVGRVLVVKVDTDAFPAVVARLGIRGIPTLILYRDGEEVARQTGAVPRDAIDEMLHAG